jgi:hypothetical protein
MTLRARLRRGTDKWQAEEWARGRRSGDYDAAMLGVRQAVADLDGARAGGGRFAAALQAHHQIDSELAAAAAAAAEIHQVLFEVAGGLHHAEVDPAVALWKRRLNTALTLRSQHQIAQADEAAGSISAASWSRSRAAFGPHQAGLDFADDPARGHGAQTGMAMARTGHPRDLDAIMNRTIVGQTTS